MIIIGKVSGALDTYPSESTVGEWPFERDAEGKWVTGLGKPALVFSLAAFIYGAKTFAIRACGEASAERLDTAPF